jgi:ADP-heptose:LPS heptosyltransferase
MYTFVSPQKNPDFCTLSDCILKKFLFIRFSSIGDIVLTTPLVRCLKNQVPGSEIHYLTKKQFVPVLEANPYIDRIVPINYKIGEVTHDLRKENYDHIIDLHKNLRSHDTILQLRKPSSSFHKINFEKWLIVNMKINLLPSTHIVDRYFGALAKTGCNQRPDGPGLLHSTKR